MLAEIYLEVARRVDGAGLVREALSAEPSPLVLEDATAHVLAVGKAAGPMLEGLSTILGPDRIVGLAIAPEQRLVTNPSARFPPRVTALVSDHPDPSERSLAAGLAALQLVSALGPKGRLIVLLSGGGSAAMAVPAPGLSLDDKRKAARAVARAGAPIGELNSVRKHLSAIKGGQLALATRAPTVVLALSDVVGNNPATIASGPFSADETTFAQALDIALACGLPRTSAEPLPAAALAHLRRGAAGEIPETPKPGDPRLAGIAFHVIAGPDRVREEAVRVIEERGETAGELARNTEAPVETLARAYGERARTEAAAAGAKGAAEAAPGEAVREPAERRPPRILVGNGEPAIVVRGGGRGGRATHLALAMAREIAGLRGVAFLAAGTDDRDGSARASGAMVDGATWDAAVRAGLDPAAALARCDSEAPLAALGCLVVGPARSNLLDLHLLAIEA
jgi:glycerate-2-kinase